ncbi:N-acetylglucosamine-6-phosphate deacetylase [Bacillus sp. FJAT-49736]|uniref:N-acetylglucosamine-6-phosphate deacetylase n=1 Tax=Bacillus sp. FJAT-49736 TaxID=2833582 RepID=UPI001BC98E38|nr:N-acetylglucosamine-6-phosphate deacetylase [Bacillus sp. FJAT-49736]MBS4174438.1 N-acetylglucosamine-6-phosphate deacetylase [Bacillus sp. FJAT-49736]
MVQKVVINANIYTGEKEIPNGYIRFQDKILETGEMTGFQKQNNEEVIDGKGNIIIPGMIDVHIHGGYGVDVMDADPEKLVYLSERLLEEGVTSFFATTITQDYDAIEAALRSVKNAKESRNTIIEGVHLEGPFISEKRAGAQPLEFIKAPDIELFLKWHEASGNLIKLVTYAPEKEGAREFEDIMIERGIVPSMGHSDAVREELMHSKTTHATHMYNGMRGLHHREAGVAGHALLSPQIQVEMIADGIHVHPDMVNLTYKIKGASGTVIISDAMRAKGMPDGVSELGGQKVYVKNGEARLENGSLAGSILTMDRAFRNIIQFTGCGIAEAVQMTSVNQAKEFSLTSKGILTEGKDADFVIMDESLQVYATYHLGRKHQRGELS